MSALVYILQENQVILAMDTLSSIRTDSGLKPFKYVSKIFPLLHMNSILCGTGNMTAILKWFEFIQTNIVANGIYQLDRLTKKNIMSFMSKENPTNESTTLYQFGIHEIDNKIYGYAYRSTNDYSSEQLPYSIGVKPTGPFETDDNLFDFLSGLLGEEALQKVMLKLKEYDDQLETQNTYKVGIGGLLEVCVFEKYSLDIKIYDIFPDYRSVHEEILKNCQLGV